MNVMFPAINNKLAFFDYDRTLVAHRYPREAIVEREAYYNECVRALTVLKDDHAFDRPLPCMQWYTKKLYDEGYGLYVLTHEVFNLRDKLKKEQLGLFYPDVKMTYLTVDTPEHKIDMIRAVADTEGCPLSDVIFVDDMLSTVNTAIRAGIDGRHLSDIVVMYETERTIQEQGKLMKKRNTEIPDEETAHDRQADITDDEMDNMLEECRILAEMNGRDKQDGLVL